MPQGFELSLSFGPARVVAVLFGLAGSTRRRGLGSRSQCKRPGETDPNAVRIKRARKGRMPIAIVKNL